MTRFLGALARAFLVVLLAVTPSAVLPGVTAEQAQIALLIGLFGGVFVMSEYSSPAPGLIGFRDAPPVNRLRFLAIFVTTFCLSALIAGPEAEGGSPALVIVLRAVGSVVAFFLDVPGSPLHLMTRALAGEGDADAIAAMCGLSFLIAVLVIAGFVLILRLGAWPRGTAEANLWVMLPTFDPAREGLEGRLRWDGKFNVTLGFCLPFLVPVLVGFSLPVRGDLMQIAPQTLIWTVAFWGWAPVVIVLRGLAMLRLAGMIRLHGGSRRPRSPGLVPL
ncbi:MAG: hypothetical protein ACU0BS_00110 [Hasllibacter sp.]